MRKYSSKVVSVRIEPELLEAVRERATAEGRSISGEIVFVLRDRLAAEKKTNRIEPISGWLRRLHVPQTYAEFREGRREASRKLLEATRRKAAR